MIGRLDCFVAICDTCNTPYTEPLEPDRIVHFPDAAKAVKAITGAAVLPSHRLWHADDAELLCPICACKRDTNHAANIYVEDFRHCRCNLHREFVGNSRPPATIRPRNYQT